MWREEPLEEPGDAPEAAKRTASPFQVARAVLWSFIGIRRSTGYEDDVAKISPRQAIIAGILGAAVFVTTLVLLVRMLTAK